MSTLIDKDKEIDNLLSHHQSRISLNKLMIKNANKIVTLEKELNNALETQKTTRTQLEQSNKDASEKIMVLLPEANLSDILHRFDEICLLKHILTEFEKEFDNFTTDVEEHFKGIDSLIQQEKELDGDVDFIFKRNLKNAKINLIELCEIININTLHDGNDSPSNIYDGNYEVWYPSLKEFVNTINTKFSEKRVEYETYIADLKREIFYSLK